LISYDIPQFPYLTEVMKNQLKGVIYTKRLLVSTPLTRGLEVRLINWDEKCVGGQAYIVIVRPLTL